MNMENDTNGKLTIVITDYENEKQPIFQIWFDDKLLKRITIEIVKKYETYYVICQEQYFFIVDRDVLSLMSKEQRNYLDSRSK
jgi:hypothetical protein